MKSLVPIEVISRKRSRIRPKQAPTGSSSEDRLREIENLKAKGLITEKEYEAKRKEVLDEL